MDTLHWVLLVFGVVMTVGFLRGAVVVVCLQKKLESSQYEVKRFDLEYLKNERLKQIQREVKP